MSTKFYVCDLCKNMVGVIHDGGGELVCCNQPMRELIPGTTDAATEKHVPAFTKEGNKLFVTVGEVEHPMTEEHHIAWIAVMQNDKTQRQALSHTGAPKAEFFIEEGPFEIYEYCNLHGLWKSEGK